MKKKIRRVRRKRTKPRIKVTESRYFGKVMKTFVILP